MIPVIDVRALDAPATLAALDVACREWGFFYAVNHGVERAVAHRVMHEAHVFFRRPLADKRAMSRTERNPWGYFDRELTKNTVDWKQIYDYGPADGGALVPQWPSDAPRFKEAVLAFYDACEALAFRLLGALATLLGVPGDLLAGAFRPEHTSFLRLNYYPKCPMPARPLGVGTPDRGHLGVNHHTDAGAITTLLQDDRPGLEVMKDGVWQLVEPRAEALVVNIGDIVQVWSNDRYRAALHRVVASRDAERFSAAFFLNPAYDARYAPLASTVDERHPPRYRAINWGEFRARRAAGDYANHGEEIQIAAYRVAGD